MSDRLVGLALLPQVREVATYQEREHDRIVQRGLDEARACRDMLAPAPVKPSLLRRIAARMTAFARSLRKRHVADDLPATADVAPLSSTR